MELILHGDTEPDNTRANSNTLLCGLGSEGGMLVYGPYERSKRHNFISAFKIGSCCLCLESSIRRADRIGAVPL
jgi:DUF1680 family protein